MSPALSRRRFLELSAGAAAVLIGGCSSTAQQSNVAASRLTSITPDPGRRPDVTASFRAAPTEIDLAGRTLRTWAYDGKVPGEVLRASVGDLVEVTVANDLPEATSVHWHGLSILNEMDGVPGLTQGDIEPGDEFTYRFIVPDGGTYWFHPHHGLQLDRGLLVPLIVEDPADGIDADVEYVVMLDDWLDGADTTPEAELASLTNMSMGEMGSMTMATSPLLGGDAGDVTYAYHLINGRPIEDPLTFAPAPRPGDRVRLRIINGAGDTAYRFAVGGHSMTVTHTDGFPVEPIDVDAILIGMGERTTSQSTCNREHGQSWRSQRGRANAQQPCCEPPTPHRPPHPTSLRRFRSSTERGSDTPISTPPNPPPWTCRPTARSAGSRSASPAA